MKQDAAYSVVKALEATEFIGTTYVLGYMIERIVNEKNAVWVVFKQVSYPFESFQYTPGGQWEDLDADNNLMGVRDW